MREAKVEAVQPSGWVRFGNRKETEELVRGEKRAIKD